VKTGEQIGLAAIDRELAEPRCRGCGHARWDHQLRRVFEGLGPSTRAECTVVAQVVIDPTVLIANDPGPPPHDPAAPYRPQPCGCRRFTP
jgi:hypothetical protein